MLSKVSTESRRARRRGLTLIELLVVVLVLAILMAVALPPYLNSVSDAQTKTCRANMQSIANAVEAAHIRGGFQASYFTGAVTSAAVGPGNALADLQAVPACPAGGSYTVAVSDGTATAHSGAIIPAGQPYVTCSVPTHGVYAPGIDSQ